MLIQIRNRAANGDRVELFLVPHYEGILRPELDIAEFELFNVFFRGSREVFVDVDADDGTCKLCETRGQEATAGADLEDVIAGFQAKCLQQTTLYLGASIC